MNELFDSLSDRDVQLIDRLVDALNQSSFDYLELKSGDTYLSIGKGALPTNALQGNTQGPAQAQASAGASAAGPATMADPAVAAAAAQQPQVDEAIEPGTVAVKAPTIGRFYSRPEPSAEPFVTVGAQVSADATIGLIEVMKLFNSVEAGVAGTVSRILVEDGELVEHGQVLMTVRPAGGDGERAA